MSKKKQFLSIFSPTFYKNKVFLVPLLAEGLKAPWFIFMKDKIKNGFKGTGLEMSEVL
jgi:hypothetical protein